MDVGRGAGQVAARGGDIKVRSLVCLSVGLSGGFIGPRVVLYRIDRGALDVQWAADGTRFAVASASKCVPVCTYDASSDWYGAVLICCNTCALLVITVNPQVG